MRRFINYPLIFSLYGGRSNRIGKKNAGYAAVDDFIHDGMIVGIGSGSTVVFAVERIAQRVNEEGLNLICIPTSFHARQMILENNLVLGDLNRYPEIDVDIDGADEVDANLNLIKGGGACLTQEKIIATNSKKMVVVADFRKDSTTLGENWKNGLPIEVISSAYVPIMKKLENFGAVPTLRMGKAKAGPVVSDNGNFIIDADFGLINDPGTLEQKLKLITGIVETGLFVNLAIKAYFGQAEWIGNIASRK